MVCRPGRGHPSPQATTVRTRLSCHLGLETPTTWEIPFKSAREVSERLWESTEAGGAAPALCRNDRRECALALLCNCGSGDWPARSQAAPGPASSGQAFPELKDTWPRTEGPAAREPEPESAAATGSQTQEKRRPQTHTRPRSGRRRGHALPSAGKVSGHQPHAATTHQPCTQPLSVLVGCPGRSHPKQKGPDSQGGPILPLRATSPSEMEGPAASLSTSTPTRHCPLRPAARPPSGSPASAERCHLDAGVTEGRKATPHRHRRTHREGPSKHRRQGVVLPSPPPPETDTLLEGRPEKVGREPLFTDSEKEV